MDPANDRAGTSRIIAVENNLKTIELHCNTENVPFHLIAFFFLALDDHHPEKFLEFLSGSKSLVDDCSRVTNALLFLEIALSFANFPNIREYGHPFEIQLARAHWKLSSR